MVIMLARHDPWRWPFATGIAVLLTLSLFFLTPESWLELGKSESHQSLEDGPPHTSWMTILPPVDFKVQVDDPPEIEKTPPENLARVDDARWWTEGWRIQTVTAVSRDLMATQVDSVEFLLAELGVGMDFMQQVRPDSVLASHLFMLQVEDSFRFDELKPYLSAMNRSRAYADIMSRANDMYGNFLQQEIMTPD